MPKLAFTFAMGAVFITLAAGIIDAQPAPPPPPGFPDYIALLDKAYNDRDIPTFDALFRDDVKVFVEGELVASGKAALINGCNPSLTPTCTFLRCPGLKGTNSSDARRPRLYSGTAQSPDTLPSLPLEQSRPI